MPSPLNFSICVYVHSLSDFFLGATACQALFRGRSPSLLGWKERWSTAGPAPGARVGPPTGNLPFYRTLPVVEPGRRRGTETGTRPLPLGCTVAERRQTAPAPGAPHGGAERPRRGQERAGVTGGSGARAVSRRHLAPGPGSWARLPLPSAACGAGKQVREIHGLPLRWDCLHRWSDSGSLNCLRSLRFTERGSVISLQIHEKLGSPFTWGWRAGSSNRFGDLRLSAPEGLGLEEKGLWNNPPGGFVRGPELLGWDWEGLSTQTQSQSPGLLLTASAIPPPEGTAVPPLTSSTEAGTQDWQSTAF